MAENKVTLSLDQMQKIARYEITFKDILDGSPFSVENVICPEVYSFTVDDLHHTFRALEDLDPIVKDFREHWYYPITQLYDAFDLNRACGYLDNPDDIRKRSKGYPGLKILDSDYFKELWLELEWACESCDEGIHLSESLDYDEINDVFNRYYSNKGKAIEEQIFSDAEMEEYIGFFEYDDFVKEVDEEKLALARKFIEYFCEKNSKLALRIKGYACYGGNRLYPCDWDQSHDCISRLYEMTDDPQYANTLGYIYYYGRCNGGVPEYDKAFHYFGIAAANGLYEGMYKLADMFRHGYACKESKRTASSLYHMVYNDCIKQFFKGKHANFADAALRMGNVYAKGIGEKINPSYAYHYYLQAYYAARLRAEEDDFFGNTTVVINVQKALEETEELLPEDYFKECVDYTYPGLFADLSSENNLCLLSRTAYETGRLELTAERMPTRSVPEPEDILITIPQLKYCERTRKASYILDKTAEIWFKDATSQVRYDYCCRNYTDERVEFYYDDELVAWVKAERYSIYGKPAEEASGPEYRIASVRFEASGRTYDYICEIENVQPGDIVIVDGYKGETEVTVTKVVSRRESELGLPAERYKKIIRKG